jgi:Fic family protein
MEIKMNTKETFDFLNSLIWIKHTHENYRALDEIKYRIKDTDLANTDWEELRLNFIKHRKTSCVPLFLDSIQRKFWFYPADCIIKKAEQLEKRGTQLHQKIVQNSNFKEEFFLDSMVEEAITSAIYEGANSTKAKAQELIVTEQAPKNKDEWMLINNYHALQWIKENRSKSLSTDLIKEVHAIVTRNTLEVDDANFSGRFRDDAVFVRSSLNEVKHEGVNHELVEASLNEAIHTATKNRRYFPAVIKGILMHYYIAYVHPFFDGNGRTARAVFYFKAMKNNLTFVELLSVSAYLKNHGKQYERSFEKVVQNDFDVTYFIDFNLDALLEAIEAVEKKVDYLLSLMVLREKQKLSENQVGLLQRLALNRFRKITIEEYATRIDKSREIARQELKQLSQLKLLVEEKDSKKFIYQIDKHELDRLITS